MDKIKFCLNGSTLLFDRDTSSLDSLENGNCGTIIQNGGALLDAAWPVKYKYEILRADPCGAYFKSAPSFGFDGSTLTITWDELPQNMPTPDLECLNGRVYAQITIGSCEDGKSLVFHCKVKNNSEAVVRQILFPNFAGLIPMAGDKNTRFTTMGLTARPFLELADNPENREYFGKSPSVCGKIYSGGGFHGDGGICGRWYDFGGLDGGVSVYRRHWGWGPECETEMSRGDQVWVKMDNCTHTMRIASIHYVWLQKGGEYDSGEYIITPHAGGWVQGVIPYKSYVNQNKHRLNDTPKRIKEALGYRTIWMSEQYPTDPDSIKYKYDDLPKVAEDMLEHGLNELSIWNGLENILPLTGERFHEELGGFEKWKENIDIIKSMGVEPSPLISVLSIWEEFRERYGFGKNDGAALGWSQNLKGVPVFASPYMEKSCCTFLWNPENELWQLDVEAALRFIRDEAGCPSICWDQYMLTMGKETVYNIIERYIKETREKYPNASFSGESTFYYERDIDQLDYTWDWGYWQNRGDCRPYIHVVGTTRPNINVDASSLYVKYCFMDNIMMNVFPSKTDDICGSAYIADYPEFSQTLKKCAALRKKYMEYFTDGEILGECVLKEDCAGARVTGYLSEDKKSVLIFAVKDSDADIEMKYDLSSYIGSGDCDIIISDIDSNILKAVRTLTVGRLTLKGKTEELFAFEIKT